MSAAHRFEPAFRRRLAANLSTHELEPEPDGAASLARAAVCLIVADAGDGEAAVLVTLRAAWLRRHANQFALPGGRVNAGELPLEAALCPIRTTDPDDNVTSVVRPCLSSSESNQGGVSMYQENLMRRVTLRVALVGLAVTLSGCAGVTPLGAGASGPDREAGCPPITTPFGNPSNNPSQPAWNRLHSGTDFNVPVGTQVHAVASGEVIAYLYYSRSDIGHINMMVYHGQDVDEKHVFSFYTHLSEQIKKPGDRVERGEVIALSGNSGTRNHIPHLHLGLWRTAVGPGPGLAPFIKQAVARLDKAAVLADPAMYWVDPSRPGFDPSKTYPKRPIRLTYPLRCSKSD